MRKNWVNQFYHVPQMATKAMIQSENGILYKSVGTRISDCDGL